MSVLNRDVENDAEAEKELAALGLKTLPVSERGGKVVVGYNVKELIAAFGISKAVEAPPDPEWMLEKYRFGFETMKRAVRQIPQDKLDWETPKRKRTLRMLTWHAFERPFVCMSALEKGEYNQKMATRYRTTMDYAAEGIVTAEDICAYGDGIEKKLEEILVGERSRLLGETVPSHMGPVTIHQLLEMALGHTFQHIRQTYEYLKMIGIEPDRPLAPEDYEGIPVTKDVF